MRFRRWAVACVTLVTITLYIHIRSVSSKPRYSHDSKQLRAEFPLVWKHVHSSKGRGGAWYIPPEWLPGNSSYFENIVDAANFVSTLTSSEANLTLPYSTIPRIVHQTWKDTSIYRLPRPALTGLESWLQDVTKPGRDAMAYFLWDNEGMAQVMNHVDPTLSHDWNLLGQNVEKTDIFRVQLCHQFGGVYADIDTMPLRPALTWVRSQDITPWTDVKTTTVFASGQASSQPVGLVLGIEADTNENSDAFWRMGYTHPVQLTQWALASARNHPFLSKFLSDFQLKFQHELRLVDTLNVTESERHEMLAALDPLEITGPAAITVSAKEYLRERAQLRWQALSGLEDGGRSKLVDDVLILPITGFSPGRGRYGRMGSKPITDPDARLLHMQQGSWKHFDFVVEYGKFCRSMFGMCRYWSKVPRPKRSTTCER